MTSLTEQGLKLVFGGSAAISAEESQAKVPVSFLVDTGAEECFISPAVAKALKLKGTGKRKPVQVASRQIARTLGLVKLHVEIQGYQGSVKFHIMELPTGSGPF